MQYMEKTNKVMADLISGKRSHFGNYSYHQSVFTDGVKEVPEWEVRQFVLNYFMALENVKSHA
ncbi:hypothetical protein GLW00_07130 [Halobacillus litoralis]|uniref:Uncharacterized protein n=1 Tax=Halobacillus litoralis TaxID=45668 RepID=A0A845FAE5_9BACI|nr:MULTISPECIES: hypothetical protein [Halobacillus]MBN9654218.1 hypothetical protein [Halobacillus sp. GSS1]MYL70615.1 hypothetical protein [Halobacillus litoralis]